MIGAIAVCQRSTTAAAGVIATLTRDGYEVVVLTGDNLATATALAREAGIDVVQATAPEDKAATVREASARHPTAMVGDGVNDAPALATADLGIAMAP